MEKKLTKKQIKNIRKFREDNPKRETTHQRRAKIKKNKAWWIPID